jgi:hypothetical protein
MRDPGEPARPDELPGQTPAEMPPQPDTPPSPSPATDARTL